MSEIVKNMRISYRMKDFDWMGYKLMKNDVYTFHHLIIPKRDGGPVCRWNGAILCGKSAHPYLHTIERVDRKMFEYITDLLIYENLLGRVDIGTIRNIYEVLYDFENKYDDARSRKGKRLIKEEYKNNRIIVD